MKRTLIIISVLLAFAYSATAQVRYTADTAKTVLQWKATKVVGGHTGKIELKNGWIDWKRNSILSGAFIIDMKTIRDEDLTDDKMKSTLENHLKSDDFFGVEKFPETLLEITSPVAFRKGEALVNAFLTIKGVRQPVVFTAKVKEEGNELIFTAPVTVDRTRFGLKYGSGKFFANLGDKAISDNFTVDVTLLVRK